MHKRILTMITSMLITVNVNAAPIVVKGSISEEEAGTEKKTNSEINKEVIGTVVNKSEELKDHAGEVEHEKEIILDTYDFTSTPQYDLKAKQQNYSYLSLHTTMSDRLRVLADGQIKFRVEKGSFRENVEKLFEHTEAVIYFPKNFPSSLRMYNDFDLYGIDTLEIFDQLLEPYRVSHNIHAWTHVNQVIEIQFSNQY